MHRLASLIPRQSESSNKKKNAINPAFILCSIIVPLVFIMGRFENNIPVVVACSFVIFLIVVSAIAAFWYMLLKNPTLLQSEDFRIRDRMIDVIQSKGTSPETAEAVTIACLTEVK